MDRVAFDSDGAGSRAVEVDGEGLAVDDDDDDVGGCSGYAGGWGLVYRK